MLGLVTAGSVRLVASRWSAPDASFPPGAPVPTADSPEPSLHRVAVFPFANLTGDPALGRMGAWIAGVLTRGLGDVEPARPLMSELVRGVLARHPDATAPEIARQLGAGILVTGRFSLQDGTLEIVADVATTATGEIRRTVRGRAPWSTREEAVDQVTERTMAAVATQLDASQARWSYRSTPTYEAFLEIQRAFERFFAGDEEGALRHSYRAYEMDTTFVTALVNAQARLNNLERFREVDSLGQVLLARWGELSRSERSWVEYHNLRARGRTHEGLRVARQTFARESDSVWGYIVGSAAMTLGRPQEALRALGRIDYRDPGLALPWAWALTAGAHHALRAYEDEARAAERGLGQFPLSLELRFARLRARVGLGDVEGLEATLQSIAGPPAESDLPSDARPDQGGWSPGLLYWRLAEELARHGYSDEARAVADRAVDWYDSIGPGDDPHSRSRALILAGRPAEALDALEALGAAGSDDPGLRGLHAVVLARLDHGDAALGHLRWLEGLDPTFRRGTPTYWRAVVVAHLGRRAEAVDLLRQAFDEGTGITRRHADALLAPLWGYPPFEGLIAPRG